MGQRSIEIVLMRQLASYLAVPILIVDRSLDLLYFNESAEPILGRRFDETGEIRRGSWPQLFQPADANGVAIPRDEQALAIAIDRNEPSYRRVWVTGLDGVVRVIQGLAIPLDTRDAGLVGAAGIFWEIREGAEPGPLATPTRSEVSRSRHPVEVILLQRIADRLAIPTIITNAEGRLIFYNPPAEGLIGRPFSELGSVDLSDWYDAFQPTDLDGSRIKLEDHPLYIARSQLQPSFGGFLYQGLDGVRRRIEGAAFPLVGQCDRQLGAVGFFWEGSR